MDFTLATLTPETHFSIFDVPNDDRHVFRIHSNTSKFDLSERVTEFLLIFRALCLQRKLMTSLKMESAATINL